MPPGALDVRAEAEGYAPATVKVDLTAGDAADLTFKPPAVSAYVNLRLNPESARGTLDHLPFPSRPSNHPLSPWPPLRPAGPERSGQGARPGAYVPDLSTVLRGAY